MSRWIRWAILLALAIPVVDHVATALTTHGGRASVEAQHVKTVPPILDGKPHLAIRLGNP